jgi:hypothetical protein
MTQLSYNLTQGQFIGGQLAESDHSWIRSYLNGTSVKKRYTISVDAAADEQLDLTLTSPTGVVTVVTYNEGAVGTVTTKRNGLIAAINASVAHFYCVAYVKDADELYIESKVAGQDFTVAEAEGNLTLTNDVALITNATIGFGLAIAQSTNDGECRRLAAVTDKVIGVSVFTHGDLVNNSVDGYPVQSAVSVLRRGVVAVKVEVNVAAEDNVFVRAVVAGTEVAGAFRNAVDSTDCIAMPGCKFLTSATAGNIALVSIDLISHIAAVAPIGVTAALTLTAPVAVALNAVFADAEVEAGLLAKADQAAVSTLMGLIEGRLDVAEAKVDAVIAALKAAGLMN